MSLASAMRQIGDGAHGRDLHRLVDRRGADIERAAEDVGEAQDVVDLVGIVGAPGRDDGVGPHRLRLFRHDLRRRVGQRQDQRIGRHLLDHLRPSARPAADRPRKMSAPAMTSRQGAGVGFLREALLARVHQLVAALVDHADEVGDQDVVATACPGRPAGPGRPAPRRRRRRPPACTSSIFLPTTFRPFRMAAPTMIAVPCWSSWKTGIFIRSRSFALDIEAFRRLDVFQVDAAEGRLHRGDDVDQLVGVASRSARCRTRRCRRTS